MKFTVAFLTIAICLFASTQGYRHKRTVGSELCPKNVDCQTYLKEKIKNLSSCGSYSTDGKIITYLGCGNAYCGKNTRKVQDLSKPYPDCCPDCEVIDPSKPAEYSRTL